MQFDTEELRLRGLKDQGLYSSGELSMIDQQSSKLYRAPHFYIHATWPARPETPQALADRFVRHIDRLKQIDPIFMLWTSGWARQIDFEKARDSYAKEVIQGLSRDDWGEPIELEGYQFGAMSRGQPDSRSFVLRMHAGSHTYARSHQNSAEVSTFSNTIPDPSALAFFKDLLLSLIEVWQPTEVSARPFALLGHRTSEGLFVEPWMQYLASPLAKLVTPPASAVVEHLPDGGLLMSATTETSRVENPEHLAAAHDIAKAIAPLNALPYVTGQTMDEEPAGAP